MIRCNTPDCNGDKFYTSRGVQVDVMVDKDGEHIKDIAFGDYYDHLGENIITCKKCGKEATLIEKED